jgi:hypothetical protein
LAAAIEGARARLDFGLWAYVFMPEHVPRLIAPRRPDVTIAAVMVQREMEKPGLGDKW